MLTISVHNIEIRAGHGLYPEEAIKGNDFEVDVDVQLPAKISDEWPLIDYSRVNEIVKAVMQGETVPLLEMLVKKIFSSIQNEWPQLTNIKVCIRKMHPPMPGTVKYAQVCFEG